MRGSLRRDACGYIVDEGLWAPMLDCAPGVGVSVGRRCMHRVTGGGIRCWRSLSCTELIPRTPSSSVLGVFHRPAWQARRKPCRAGGAQARDLRKVSAAEMCVLFWPQHGRGFNLTLALSRASAGGQNMRSFRRQGRVGFLPPPGLSSLDPQAATVSSSPFLGESVPETSGREEI